MPANYIQYPGHLLFRIRVSEAPRAYKESLEKERSSFVELLANTESSGTSGTRGTTVQWIRNQTPEPPTPHPNKQKNLMTCR